MKTIIVILTTIELGTPHLDIVTANNPDTDISVYTHVRTGIKAIDHPNCDRMMYDWWHELGKDLDFDYVVFLEWDVLFNQTLEKAFPFDTDFVGCRVIMPDQAWKPFQDIKKLPDEMEFRAIGIVPLAVIRMSRKCIQDICEHPQSETVFNNTIWCELRLPTMARTCGHQIKSTPALRNIHSIHEEGEVGIFHPIKP